MTEKFKQLKKYVTESWQSAFPQLTAFTPTKLYKIVGPVIIGLELIRLPFAEEYRPHFILYPLWREDIKACLDYPIVLQEFKNRKGMQFSIPYNRHDLYFAEMLESIKKQKNILFTENASSKNLLLLMDEYSKTSPTTSASGSYLRARFQEAMLKIALYQREEETVKSLLAQIQKRNWDKAHFKSWNSNVSDWLQNLNEEIKNQNELIARVELNKQDQKMSKLKVHTLYTLDNNDKLFGFINIKKWGI
jgi:hypothetical protein